MHKKTDWINLYSQYKKVISFQIWKRKFKFTYEIASSTSPFQTFRIKQKNLFIVFRKVPFEVVHIDYFNWYPVNRTNTVKKHVLVFVDAFTIHMRLYAVKSTIRETIGLKIISEIIVQEFSFPIGIRVLPPESLTNLCPPWALIT